MTKGMHKESISPFSWDKEVVLESFQKLDDFNLKPHLSKNVDNCLEISYFFNFFINDEMIELIVRNTNKIFFINSSKDNRKNYMPASILEPLTSIELRSFFGLLLLFG